MLITPIWPKMIARPRAISSSTQNVLSPLNACIAQIERSMLYLEEGQSQCRFSSLVALGERIRLDQLGLVKHLVLAIHLHLADAQLAPQVVVLVDLHVALGRGRELEAG